MYKTLYNNYKFFPVQFIISSATNNTKTKLADSIVRFRLFFVQYFSVQFLCIGQVAPESGTYESWYYAIVLSKFVCLALFAESPLY